MRWLVGVGSAMLLALAVTAGAPGRASDDVRTIALKTVETNVDDAIKLELSALRLAAHGNVPGARQELKNAHQLLEGAFPAADALTIPADLRHYVPDNSWERLGRNIRTVARDDEEAIAHPGKVRTTFVLFALNTKQEIYKLVHREETRPACSVLIDRRGPITVNGVAQGPGQLSVDVSCTTAIKRLLVDLPRNKITQTATDGGAKSVALKSANIVQVGVTGKEGGVTAMTVPDPSAGLPVDVVVIAGDSTDYFPETM